MKWAWRFAGLLAVWLGTAWSGDFRTTSRAAILYDAPAATATKRLIAGPQTPLEVFIETADWVKVRAPSGALLWIERAALGGKPAVMINVDEASIRQSPRPDAEIVFRAGRGVLLESLGESQGSWIHVKHADGLAGWVQPFEVWGW